MRLTAFVAGLVLGWYACVYHARSRADRAARELAMYATEYDLHWRTV